MLELLLPSGLSFELPNDGCQELLLVVRTGRVSIAVAGLSPRTLGPEAAARLPMGAAEPGRVEALEDARAFVVVARTVDRAFEPGISSAEVLSAPGECRARPGEPAAFFAEAGTTGPFSQGSGALRAYVYLDMPRHQAGLASVGYLDGDATVAVPEHGHERSAEVLYFESGEGTMRVGDETTTIGPGRFVYVPAGVRHSLVPTGRSPLRALQVYTPSGPEQRFRPLR